jgi:hypothetical protein
MSRKLVKHKNVRNSEPNKSQQKLFALSVSPDKEAPCADWDWQIIDQLAKGMRKTFKKLEKKVQTNSLWGYSPQSLNERLARDCFAFIALANDQLIEEVSRIHAQNPVVKPYFDLLLPLHFELSCLAFFGVPNKDIEGAHTAISYSPLFWGLFGSLLTLVNYPFLGIQAIEQAIHHGNRLTLALEERQSAFLTFNAYGLRASALSRRCTGRDFDYHLGSFETFIELKDEVQDRIDKSTAQLACQTRADGSLFVYRGFDIAESDNVRKGRKRVGNPDLAIQEAGRGLSFTTDKGMANTFATHRFLPSSSTWSIKRRTPPGTVLRLHGLSDQQFREAERKPVVAEYEVSSDKLLLHNAAIEDEVFVLPKDAQLKRYKFVKYSA